jgi:hypothetical protein
LRLSIATHESTHNISPGPAFSKKNYKRSNSDKNRRRISFKPIHEEKSGLFQESGKLLPGVYGQASEFSIPLIQTGENSPTEYKQYDQESKLIFSYIKR